MKITQNITQLISNKKILLLFLGVISVVILKYPTLVSANYWPYPLDGCNSSCASPGGVCIEGGYGYACEYSLMSGPWGDRYYTFEDYCKTILPLGGGTTAWPCPPGELCRAYTPSSSSTCGNACYAVCDCSAPTCPGDSTTTNTGANCYVGYQSCADGCLSRTVNTGTSCYDPESNFSPATPSAMYVCFSGVAVSNCTSLSTSSSSPTTIDLPAAGTAVYMKTADVTDYGGSRNGLQYLIQVNNTKNGWPNGTDDHSSGWIDNNYTVNLRNSIGLTYEANYQLWSYSGTQNVCTDDWRTAKSAYYYLRINACSGSCTPTCSVGSTTYTGPDCYSGISSCTDVCGVSHTGSSCYTSETNFDPNPPAPVYICTGTTSNCTSLSTNSSSPTMIDLPSAGTAVYVKSSAVANSGGSEDGLWYLHQVNNTKNFWNSSNMYTDDYSSGWVTSNNTANIRNLIGLNYDASYQTWAYSGTKNVCDSDWETGQTGYYYFKVNPEPCDNTCSLTCPVGTSTTYTGFLCASSTQSCTDECGDLHTGSTCYLPETNTTPSLPSQMYFCTGDVNNCVALSSSSSSPTIIDLPTAGTTVYLKSASVSWPSNARDLDYELRASDWGSVNYSSGWIGNRYTGNVSSNLGLAYDKSYYVYTHTRSLNRCDNSWKSNMANSYFYFRIAEEPCNDTCSLTCPVGSSTTYSGFLCTNGSQSCVDGCGDTHLGSVCYLPETNTIPNLPSVMYICIGSTSSCTSLSKNQASPTVINLPSAGTPVYLTSGTVSLPSNARDLDYNIRAYDWASVNYDSGWLSTRTTPNIYSNLALDYDKDYYARVYTRSLNRCDNNWLVNNSVVNYYFSVAENPCSHECTPTCPSGSSLTNTGSYCTGSTSSCVDECGDSHLGNTCYYYETNTAPDIPSPMEICIGGTASGDCTTLSSNALNPTRVVMPAAGTSVYIKSNGVTIPVGSNSRGLRYLLQVNNLVNGWSGDCGNPSTNDFCSGWQSSNLTTDLRNSIGLLEGASYQTMAYAGTLDRCDDDILSSGMAVGYFVICTDSCSCTPTCASGTSTTNTGPYCAASAQVCNCNDTCGNPHEYTGSTCYLPETNTNPDPSDSVYYCINGTAAENCTALSTNAMNPTLISVPGSSQQVFIKAGSVAIPVGSNSRGIEYSFMVNNLVNGWSGDCGSVFEDDYCRTWDSSNSTIDLRNLIGMDGGASYQIMSYAGALDRCDDDILSSVGTVGYLRICVDGCSCSPVCTEGTTTITGPYCEVDDSTCNCVDDCGSTQTTTGSACYLSETNLEPEAPENIYLCLDGTESGDCMTLSENPFSPTLLDPPDEGSTLFIKVDDVVIPVGSNSRGIEYDISVNNITANGWSGDCESVFENDYCSGWQAEAVTSDLIDEIGIDDGESYQTWAYPSTLDRCDDDRLPGSGIFGYFAIRRAPSCDMDISHTQISHLSEEDLIATLTVYDGNSDDVDVDWHLTNGCGSLDHETSLISASPEGVDEDNQISFDSSVYCQGDEHATVWVDLDDGNGSYIENACSVDFEITNAAPSVGDVTPSDEVEIGNEEDEDLGYSCVDNNPMTYTAEINDLDGSFDVDVMSLNIAREGDSNPASVDTIDLYRWPLKVMFAQRWEGYGGDGSANYTFYIKDGNPNVNSINDIDCYFENGDTELADEDNRYCMMLSDSHNYKDGVHVTEEIEGVDYDIWYLDESRSVIQSSDEQERFAARLIGSDGGDWHDSSYVRYEIDGSGVYVHFVVAFEGSADERNWENHHNNLWYASDLSGQDDGLGGNLWSYDVNGGSDTYNFHIVGGTLLDFTPPVNTAYFTRRKDALFCGNLEALEVCYVQTTTDNRFPDNVIDTGIDFIGGRHVDAYDDSESVLYSRTLDDVLAPTPDGVWTNADIISITEGTEVIEGFIDIAADKACNMSSMEGVTMSVGGAWLKTVDGDVYSAMGYSNIILNDYQIDSGNWSMADHWLSGGLPHSFGPSVEDPSFKGWNSDLAYENSDQEKSWYDRLEGMARRSSCANILDDTQCILDDSYALDIDSVLTAIVDGIYYVKQEASETPISIGSGAVCNGVKAIFVEGDLSIEPNFTVADDSSGCLFVVSGDVEIGAGGDSGVGPDDGNLDLIQAAFVTDGKYSTASDAHEDQLKIEGFVFADNDNGISTQFERSLSYTNNMLYPAEVVQYDPRYLLLFRDLISKKSYSQFECGVVQNSETCAWEVPEEEEE